MENGKPKDPKGTPHIWMTNAWFPVPFPVYENDMNLFADELTSLQNRTLHHCSDRLWPGRPNGKLRACCQDPARDADEAAIRLVQRRP